MYKYRIFLTFSIILAINFNQPTLARGGGFARAGGFDRGFDGHGSDVGDVHGFFNQGFDHPAGFTSAYHGDASYAARSEHLADTPAIEHSLSTDGGLNREALSAGAAHVGGYQSSAGYASHAETVRGAYDYHGEFNDHWWADHPHAWGYAAAWRNGWAWGSNSWTEMAGWWGMPIAAVPVYYDYGNNITYQNDQVYYGSQPLESTVAYYDQAQTLATTMPTVPAGVLKAEGSEKDWKPLGVYSLVQGGQTNTNMMFQLAVSKAGVIKGNYYNTLTDETKPVAGNIDKKNMRAAWIVGSNKNIVYDTGLANLLKDQSPILVHLNKDKTEQWTLVKLQQSKKET